MFLWLAKPLNRINGGLLWETAKSVTWWNAISFVVFRKHTVLAHYNSLRKTQLSFEKCLLIKTASRGREEKKPQAPWHCWAPETAGQKNNCFSEPDRSASKFTECIAWLGWCFSRDNHEHNRIEMSTQRKLHLKKWVGTIWIGRCWRESLNCNTRRTIVSHLISTREWNASKTFFHGMASTWS